MHEMYHASLKVSQQDDYKKITSLPRRPKAEKLGE